MGHNNFSFDLFCFLLVITVISVEGTQSAINDQQAIDSEEPQMIVVQELKDSRTAKRDQRYYKCYEGIKEKGGGNKFSECIGRICIRIIHHQTDQQSLSCANFTELPVEPGKCAELSDDQMPGQTETFCTCFGNFCNRASSATSISLILLIVSSLIVLLLCSSLVGAVIYTR